MNKPKPRWRESGTWVDVLYRNQVRANDALAAAAPDLLDFAIQVLYSLAGECALDDCAAPYTNEELGIQARAAIAKANGGKP